MKKVFDYDNLKFAQLLQERGFFVASQSLTRFKTTERSLATSLNMEYIPKGKNPFNLIRKNRVTRFLKKQGYYIINFSHWTKGILELSDRIYYYSKGKFSFLFTDFSKMFWEKSLFLFSTHGAAAGSDHALNALDAAKSLASGADIIGTYSCQGEVNPKVLEKAKSKPEPPVWIADAPNAAGHPDAADIEVLKYQISELL